jgi:hypothetical protein
MAHPTPVRPLHTVQDEREEREARVSQIMARARHHQEQAAKHLAEAERLKAHDQSPNAERGTARQ